MTTRIKFIFCFKKLFIFFVIALLTIMITSCKKNNEPYLDDAIAIVYQNNVPYLINANKQTYSLSKYDEISDEFAKYIIVKKNNLYGVIENTGKEIIEPIYNKVYPIREEKCVVIKDGNYFIIDTTGKTLYTFTDNIFSVSSFYQNNLVITDGLKYGFLVYNDTDNTFTPTELAFDYASHYQNDYAIVAKREEIPIYDVDEKGNPTSTIIDVKYLDNLKYNYLDLNHELLFNDFDFDFADFFYDGWARVGNESSDITCTIINTNGIKVGSKNISGVKYKYVNTKGQFLNYNFSYTYSERQYEVKGEISVPYASNFSSGYAVIAGYACQQGSTAYLKEYIIIDTLGHADYLTAIKNVTGFSYGNDKAHSISPGQYWIGDIVKIDESIIFRTGITCNGTSWQICYSRKDYTERPYENNFYDVKWDIIKKETSEDNTIKEIVPDWIYKFNDQYLDGASSTYIAENAAKKPYELDDLKYSDNYLGFLTKARINYSNKFGLITITSSSVLDDTSNREVILITASYLLDPIYDKIIY